VRRRLAPAGPRDAGAFRHLGIAYDGSAEAAAALASGYALAVRDRAAVSIFYAITARGLAWTGQDPDEMERGLRAERLRAHELLDAAADAAPAGVNPRTVLLFGDPGAPDHGGLRRHRGHRLRGLRRPWAGAPRAGGQRLRSAPARRDAAVRRHAEERHAARRGRDTRRERGRTMTRLLIAFDGSDRAAEAVLAAARLFPGAEAIVLSVANDPWDLDPVPVTTLTLAGRSRPRGGAGHRRPAESRSGAVISPRTRGSTPSRCRCRAGARRCRSAAQPEGTTSTRSPAVRTAIPRPGAASPARQRSP
jgi:hypothetical protein